MKTKDVTPTSPLRHENQRRPMSTKTERLVGFYREHLELHYSERTAPDYLSHVRSFLEWSLERGLELTEIRTRDLQSYQNELLGKRKQNGTPYSLGFHHNRLVAIRSLFRFLYKNGYLLHDPARAVELKQKEKRLPRVVLTLKEAKRILAASSGTSPRELRDRAILETLYATGIRASELANLELRVCYTLIFTIHCHCCYPLVVARLYEDGNRSKGTRV